MTETDKLEKVLTEAGPENWSKPEVIEALQSLARIADRIRQAPLIDRVMFRDGITAPNMPEPFKAVEVISRFSFAVAKSNGVDAAAKYVAAVGNTISPIILPKPNIPDLVGLGAVLDGRQSFLVARDRYYTLEELDLGVRPMEPTPNVAAWMWLLDNEVVWNKQGDVEKYTVITFEDESKAALFKLLFVE